MITFSAAHSGQENRITYPLLVPEFQVFRNVMSLTYRSRFSHGAALFGHQVLSTRRVLQKRGTKVSFIRLALVPEPRMILSLYALMAYRMMGTTCGFLQEKGYDSCNRISLHYRELPSSGLSGREARAGMAGLSLQLPPGKVGDPRDQYGYRSVPDLFPNDYVYLK